MDRLDHVISPDVTPASRQPNQSPAQVEPGVAETSLFNIVVVGGGAAGLELVTRLGARVGRSGRARITLVDRARAHVWKPLLHEVAAGSLDPDGYEVSYRARAHRRGFHYCFGALTGLDRKVKQIHLAAMVDDEGRQITPPRCVGYDLLVIAIGTAEHVIGFPFGRGRFVEGLFARMMYHSLRLMHEQALMGTSSAIVRFFSRTLSRHSGPPVKLH